MVLPSARPGAAILLYALLLAGFPAGREAAADPAATPAVSADPSRPAGRHADSLRAGDRSERFLAALRSHLGAPYRLDPLGEGAGAGVDPDPLIDLEHFDCVTLLETALAQAVAGPGDSLVTVLSSIRYRGGRISFLTRNHFFVPDWIPANRERVEDITAELGGAETVTVTRTVGRRRFLRAKGVTASPEDGHWADQPGYATDVIPAGAFARVAGRIEEPLIIVLVGKVDWLFALHTGAVYRSEAGRLMLVHASSKRGMVAEEDLLDYLAGTDRYLGVKLLRILD